jgi:hypothetical protein
MKHGNAEDVWKELPNPKMASAYVQAYRIDKVIQAKGDDKFLGSGEIIHYGIRKDFKFTANGIERIHKIRLVLKAISSIAMLLFYHRNSS